MGLSAFVIAFLFRPLLIRVEQGVDRLFYREKYELHQALEEVIQALIAARHSREIFQKVFELVARTLHVSEGALWLRNGEAAALQPVAAQPAAAEPERPVPRLTASEHLARYFIETRQGLTRYQVRRF